MFYVKLLYRHSTAGTGYRPHQLRDVCERAIHEFKNNSLFLSVFYHNEREFLARCEGRYVSNLTHCLCSPHEDSESRSPYVRQRASGQGCHERRLAVCDLRRDPTRLAITEFVGCAQSV